MLAYDSASSITCLSAKTWQLATDTESYAVQNIYPILVSLLVLYLNYVRVIQSVK